MKGIFKVEDYPFESTVNGMCFKDHNAFNAKTGVCYIPELAYEEDGIYDPDCVYDYDDFVRIARECIEGIREKDVEDYAGMLFEQVDWQAPESLAYETNYEDERE